MTCDDDGNNIYMRMQEILRKEGNMGISFLASDY